MRVVALLMVTVLWHTVSAAGNEERPMVATEDGLVQGFQEKSTLGNTFYSFQSIPYAEPPVGDLRFKDPVAGAGWTGVRDGRLQQPLCSQLPFLAVTSRRPEYHGQEDCLYLSVHTPQPSEREARLPVLVFFHGGAFFAGGARMYPPYVLLNQDVVLVVVGYRLGILGFLSTEDAVIPGNFGLKDQTAALRWLQANVHHFGGDARRVTLFGESAGGASVHFHVLSPHSRGLFERAILQSGTLFSPWAMGGAFRQVASYTGRLFGCDEPDSDAATSADQGSANLLSCLQAVPVENLTMSLMHHFSFNFNPVLLGARVDGDYLPAAPETLMAQGRHHHVDLISGVNSHEGGLFVCQLYEDEVMQSQLLDQFETIGPESLDLRVGDSDPEQLARRIFQHYVGGVSLRPEDADNLCRLYGDHHFNVGHDLNAALHSRNVSPHKKTFLYTLQHKGQHSFCDFYDSDVSEKWVSHVDELFYLFTGEDTLWKPLEQPDDLKLRNIMVALWTNFAATGNPTPDDSLGFKWKDARPDNLQHLALTPSPRMRGDDRVQVRKFWESLPTQQNKLLHPDKVVPFVQQRESAPPATTDKPLKYARKTEL